MNHIFVDYENTKGVDPAIFALESATFTLLLGPHNKSFDIGVVEKIMKRAAAVELVRLKAAGKNAVDFALTYYLGRKTVTDPTAQFTLISKDKGYDPLIDYLCSLGLKVSRHDDFAVLAPSTATEKRGGRAVETVAKPAPAEAKPKARAAAKTAPASPTKRGAKKAPTLFDSALDYLKRRTVRAKTRKSLTNDLRAHLGKEIPEAELEVVLKRLQTEWWVRIDEQDVVTYLFEDKRP